MAQSSVLGRFNYDWLESTISIAFAEDDDVEYDIFHGPIFSVWGIRDDWDKNTQQSLFSSRNRSSIFCFKFKHMHIVGLGNKAFKALTLSSGRPLSITEIGTIADINELIQRIDEKFDDNYFVRYIPAPRGRDALALTYGENNYFIPIKQWKETIERPMQLTEYIDYAELI